MSDFDKDTLFSDIDKIMEQQGYTNIVSSSTPVEVEAKLDQVPEKQPEIQQHELEHIERVVNPQPMQEIKLEPASEFEEKEEISQPASESEEKKIVTLTSDTAFQAKAFITKGQ